MGLLYTVGHSQHDFEYFNNLLKNNNINYLLDVRSTRIQSMQKLTIGNILANCCWKKI